MTEKQKASGDTPPPSGDEKATAEVVAVAVEKQAKAADLQKQREDLERQLATLDAKAKAEGLTPDVVPTHILVLANGSRVESAGAVPTHHATADGRVLPVDRVYSLEGMTGNA